MCCFVIRFKTVNNDLLFEEDNGGGDLEGMLLSVGDVCVGANIVYVN